MLYKIIIIPLCLISDPNTAPRNFRAVRLSGSIMELFWNPLTLSEAKGFMTAYTVSYRQLTTSSDSGELEELQETAIRNDGTIVTGLEEDATYLVQVWASTAAGAGERSPILLVQLAPTTTTEPNGPVASSSTGAIIGAVVAVILIVAITVFAVAVIVALTLKGKQHTKTNK